MPEFYLKSCRDCIDFARDAQDTEARSGYLTLAQQWLRLYVDGMAATDAHEDDAPPDGSRSAS